MSATFVPLTLIVLIGLIGVVLLLKSARRGAIDVLIDLDEQRQEQLKTEIVDSTINKKSTGLLGLEVLVQQQLRRSRVFRQIFPVLFALIGLSTFTVFGVRTLQSSIMAAVSSWALAYLFIKQWERKLIIQLVKRTEFFLPIVMERIVMAVQAGLDVVASIKTVIEYEKFSGCKTQQKVDPVTMLFKQVYTFVENGRSLVESLNYVAAAVPCPALRHAFIHLALAHREGGELIMPLRELSESTQLYYQESVEEDIAKMPVKATLPLLCTFTGLITFFLTAPIMQVMQITTDAVPK